MNNNSKLNKLENKLRFSNYSDKKEMLNYIKMGIYDFDEDILYDILMVILEKNFPFIDAMNNAKMLYEIIVFDKENIEERLLKVNSNSFLGNLNISNYDLNFLSLLYFSLYNDTSDFFDKLIQKGIPLNKIEFYFLDKENISKFGEENYLYLILNKLDLFTLFGNHNDLDTLYKLLKLNPNYENFANTYDEVKKAIEVFKIENIADRNEIIDMIVKNYYLDYFEFLKGLYDINENLCTSLDEKLRELTVYKNSCLKKLIILYTPYEFSTLTNKQQEALIDFINIKEVTTVKNYKEIIKKLISVKDEELELTKTAYTIFYLDRTNLEIDDYLSLNLEEKKNFIEKCNFIYEKYSKTLKPRLKRLESKYKR